MPSVGYLITLYNKEPFLKDVVQGLASQAGNFTKQYVFVDDGSTDNTLAKIKEYAKHLPNCLVLSQKNQGPSVAFNHGLAHITAQYVKPLDGDDVLPPDATHHLLDGLRKFPKAVVAFGNQGFIGENGAPAMEPHWSFIPAPLEKTIRRAQILSPSAWLAKTTLVKEGGGSDDAIFVQDYSLELRLAQRGPFVKTAKTIYFSPRLAPGRVSENVAQTLHDLNFALANFCEDTLVPQPVRQKIWHRAASRAYRWCRRSDAPFRDKGTAFLTYLRSFFPKIIVGQDVYKTCLPFQKTAPIRLPLEDKKPFKEKVRIMHVLACGTLKGGTERFMARLVKALKDTGVQQQVICRQDDPQAAAFFKNLGVPTVAASLKKRDILSKIKIKNAFKAFAPTIALSWLPRAAQRVPQGPWLKCAQVTWHQGMGCYQDSDVLLVPSPGLKNHMANQTTKPVFVLPHFTDHFSPATITETRRQSPPVILGLGRFDFIKGFDLAIQALKDVPKAQLWLAGEGEQEEPLKALAVSLGLQDRVVFLPWTENIAPLLAQASVLVVPSRQEALGLVILEAWKQGVPVVASKTDGPLYLIEDNRTGLLVEKGSVESLTTALTAMLGDAKRRQELALNGKKMLEAQFTAEKTVDAYLKLFEKLVEARKQR